jgi:hypothetical protein
MELRLGERAHNILDLAVLMSVVCLALGSWACFGEASGAAAWRPFLGVAIALLFALASLTRHPHWAASIRLFTGAWIIVAPYLLGCAAVAPAARLHLAIGTLVVAASLPGLPLFYWRRLRFAA